jgi:hypothetical protein
MLGVPGLSSELLVGIVNNPTGGAKREGKRERHTRIEVDKIYAADCFEVMVGR